jgi:hypothetical protein
MASRTSVQICESSQGKGAVLSNLNPSSLRLWPVGAHSWVAAIGSFENSVSIVTKTFFRVKYWEHRHKRDSVSIIEKLTME